MENQNRKPLNATLDEASDFLRLSRRSVQNYQNRGLLTPVMFGKRRLFRWAELERLAKRGVPRGKAQPEEVTA